MKKIILILALILLVSCDIQKEASKTKTDTNLKQSEETHTFRKGDTVSYSIPKISYKDTTIYTTNRQGTTLRTIYDNNGKVSNVECYASQIEELTRKNVEFQQALKEKQSTKTEKANFGWVFYLVGGVVLVLFFAIFMIYRMINNHAKIISEISKTL